MIDLELQPQLPLPALLSRLAHSDLRPSPAINHLFTQLVAMSLSDVQSSATDRSVARELAAKGEYELEKSWAARIADGESVESFPYIDNYLALAEHEYDALMQYADRAGSWAFVGSGPLPLTQLLFQRMHGGQHTFIERDLTAHTQGISVSRLLADEQTQQHVHADAMELGYDAHDIVVMAALVGKDDQEKLAILQHIVDHATPGTLVAARSVPDDGRTLLYPRLTSLPNGVTALEETIPPEGVINSLVIMRVNER